MSVVVHKSPSTRQSQPMGFSGRLEAISAPTSGKTRKRACPSRLPVVRSVSRLRATWVEWASIHSATLPTNMTTERAASDHASQEVPRELILPTPCSCSLVPDVTTPLYSTIVSQALRQPLRGHAVANFRECPLAEVPPALC